MDCLFCKIVKNDIPSYTIYEDEIVKAFLDISPDCNGHTLIVPKKHCLDITDIDDNTLIHIMDVARHLKKLLEDVLKIDGLTLIQNNGDVQEIKHYHLHLKPHYKIPQALIEVEKAYSLLIKKS